MTGSIEKRGKNSYRLVVFKGYDLDGKSVRHQKTVHCKNKSEAQIELAKFVAQIENGFVVKFEDMEIKKIRKGLLTYKIRIEFKDGSKANIQILKRVAKMYAQKQYGQKLFNKFIEIKNKSEKKF